MPYFRLYYLLLCILPISTMSAAFAADVAPPKNAEVIDDLTQPPKTLDQTVEDNLVEPQITIKKKGSDTVEEYRINGQLYMMKITPVHGVPYYLQKQDQEGGWSRTDGPSAPLAIPKWIIFRF